MINLLFLKLLLISLLLTICNSLYAEKAFGGSNSSVELFSNQNNKYFYYFKMGNWYYVDDVSIKSLGRNNTVMRSAVAYNASKKLSLWLGYGVRQLLSDSNAIEQMAWEQAEFEVMRRERMIVVQRSRLEERVSHLVGGTSVRLREATLIKFKQLISEKISPVFFEEAFILLNHPAWVSKKTISANRAFLGVEIPLDKQMGLQVGYMNLMLNADKTQHVNMLYLSFIAHFE